MLTLNTVSFAGTTITGNFSVDMSDIDPGAGEDSYAIVVKRHSDGVTVHTALTGTVVNNGVGIFTGNTSTVYGVFGVYDITVVPTEGGDTVNATSNSLALTIGVTTVATGSGREYTATQRAHTVGQRYFDIKGNGPTEDAAIIELGRKITLGHGSVVLLGRPRISVVMADADFNGDTGALGAGGYAARVAARDSAGEQENVQITLEQTFDAGTIDERVETATIRIAACSDSIKLAGTAVNDIDPANAKVTAFVTAYYDSDGNNGYQFRSGKFVR